MGDPSGLKKARFIELDANFKPKNGGKDVEVQFNPETLKVSFSNQIDQGGKKEENSQKGTGDQSNKAAKQYVGAGTTKLSLQLWFDVNAPQGNENNKKYAADVRDLTKEIAYFITPQEVEKTFIPPAVQFAWGSFHFDGLVDSIEESLEFFSHEGVPLRASMSISMSQQKIETFTGNGATKNPPGSSAPGTSLLATVSAGATLQGMADSQGKGDNWQAIAAANNIENPRLLTPGMVINMNLK
ncbi:MAG: LysM peptidoglycan-binding domain-containing protein [Desulfuromonadaceae bacterium]|nr:LysM peptidoglycan-binding domain-containing protein [Desulfuromonadaceae bacterium]